MSREIVVHQGRDLGPAGGGTYVVPALIADAGEDAVHRFVEFFTANIRNANTRAAYFRCIVQFDRWVRGHGLALLQLRPPHVAAYIEELSTTRARPTVKQHLAAIRMLFDWLVVRQVMPLNPAHAVRGPKYKVTQGKTPVLNEDEARHLLESIRVTHVVGHGQPHPPDSDKSDMTADGCHPVPRLVRCRFSYRWRLP